jgi:hypothetical protein
MKPFVMGEITPQPGCRYASGALSSATMKHAPPHSITSSARVDQYLNRLFGCIGNIMFFEQF